VENHLVSFDRFVLIKDFHGKELLSCVVPDEINLGNLTTTQKFDDDKSFSRDIIPSFLFDGLGIFSFLSPSFPSPFRCPSPGLLLCLGSAVRASFVFFCSLAQLLHLVQGVHDAVVGPASSANSRAQWFFPPPSLAYFTSGLSKWRAEAKSGEAEAPFNLSTVRRIPTQKKKIVSSFVDARILFTDWAEERASRRGTSSREGRRPSRSRPLHRVLGSS